MANLIDTEHVYPTLGAGCPVVAGPFRGRVVRCRDCVFWDDGVCHIWSDDENACIVFTEPDGFCYLGEADD